ncbi:MAG: 16S rRNA (cytidine(1402)-2'-O)-methyltransferase [Candidatus Lindowbacteria bacterium]|nr:16S rRNA (cytidine(1402)-2'-O)-methyltransferase [Candidatus Lindowbacteria bacterium]
MNADKRRHAVDPIQNPKSKIQNNTTATPPNASSQPAGTLYIVGTPIGNLEDITLRALRILKDVGLIAAEDTRRTRKLLSHYDIHTPLVSYHEHNKLAKTPMLIAKLKEGPSVALVSDAGMPGISDPGHDLIVAALKVGIGVTVVPGPSSIIAALVLSGLPTAEFCFAGFAPRKPGERSRFLEKVLTREATSVLFESPTRLVSLLEAIAQFAPEREIAVARELTKKFEEVMRGTAAQVAAHFREHTPLGECVVLLHGAMPSETLARTETPPHPRELVDTLMRERGLSKKDAMRHAAQQLGLSRREVYKALLQPKPAE